MPEQDGSDRTLEALQEAELEQLRLLNDKLKLDLAEAREAKPWRHTLAQLVPLITAAVAVAGFLWGVFQYRQQQVEDRAARRQQSKEERQTAEREFMQPWLASQRGIYLEALTAATTAANSDDPARRRAAAEEFWKLYQGKMILVETKSVSGAMVQFGRCLDRTEECSRGEMNSRCRALATAMAESMAATARMTFADFRENQFRYGAE